jgi:hypothetical protein
MTHSEFVAAHARGEIRVEIDPRAAERFLSARLLLPFVMMPVIGAGVALALIGWIYTGLAVIALGLVAPRLIKRSAPRFLLQNALEDGKLYDELVRSNIIRLTSPERVTPFPARHPPAAAPGPPDSRSAYRG